MYAELKKELKGHAAAVYTLHLDKSSNRIFSGSADRMVGVWQSNNLEPDPFSIRTDQAVFSIEKQANHLYVGQGSGGVHVIDLQSRQEIRHLKYHNRAIFQILSHPLKPYLYFLGGDGLLSIVDHADYSLKLSLPISEAKLRTASLSANRELLFVGSGDGYIRILETDYYNVLNDVKCHEGGVYDMVWLSDNEVITVGRDGHIRLWKLRDHQLIEYDKIPAHNYAVYSIDISPSGQKIATASRDKTVKIWEMGNLRKPLRIQRVGTKGHTHSVNVVKWVNDNLLVSAGDDRSLFFWTISDS
jgi:WD40 repeat protein